MTLKTRRYRYTRIISIVFSFLLSAVISLIIFKIGDYNPAIDRNTIVLIVLFIVCFSVLYMLFMRRYIRRRKILEGDFPGQWEDILGSDVPLYRALSDEQKSGFREKLQVFLGEKPVSGIGTEVDERTRVLAGASAVIPVLNIPEWEYDKIAEVLIYPSNFDENFNFDTPHKDVLGMVVSNSSSLILSKPALLHGFRHSTDNINTGIHEFFHKIDEEDGAIDGVPALLMDKKLIHEWKEVMTTEMENIRNGASDINPYALTSEAEFFAVAGEYFFEYSMKMKESHPALYDIMNRMFGFDTASLMAGAIRMIGRRKKIGRNRPCPCGSGKKYKKCCLKKKWKK